MRHCLTKIDDAGSSGIWHVGMWTEILPGERIAFTQQIELLPVSNKLWLKAWLATL